MTEPERVCKAVCALDQRVVPRHLQVRYRGIGLDGKPIEREAAGFHARVVQHECDHLDGILYPQRMTDHRLLVYLEELQRHPIDLAEFLAAEAGK